VNFRTMAYGTSGEGAGGALSDVVLALLRPDSERSERSDRLFSDERYFLGPSDTFFSER
jgi:hypothetical protein